MEPATSQLLIVMELMAATAADLVRPTAQRFCSRVQQWVLCKMTRAARQAAETGLGCKMLGTMLAT